MPKCYSEQERAYIRRRLHEEAAECLARFGIRRTTVDEIVKRVRIPKGTFYLFYPSKEMLLFEVILEQHDRMEQEIICAVSALHPAEFTVEQLTELLTGFYKKIEEMPILQMLNSDEIEVLARKLPPEVLEKHMGHDSSMLDKIFFGFPGQKDGGCNVDALSAAFRGIYFVTLHKKEIGEEHYEEALKLLVRGLVSQIL